MSAIKTPTFGGIMPRINPKLLPDTAAVLAHNCKFKSGSMQPLNESGSNPYSVEFLWTSMVGVAVDTNGNVYVSGPYNDSLFKVNPSGHVTTLSDTITGVTGIAVDASGNAYAASVHDKCVYKVTASGSVSVAASGLFCPCGVAVDSSGNVYVVDSGSNSVTKVLPNGSSNVILNDLQNPCGITVDKSGNVYIADTNSSVIVKITATGVRSVFAGSVGSEGFVNGASSVTRFNIPIGIAVDTNGNLYVSDYGNSAIRKITAAGVSTTSLSGCTPSGIAVDTNGNMYIVDLSIRSITKVNSSGTATTIDAVSTASDSVKSISSARSIYLWRYGDNASDVKWLSWIGDVQVAPTNLADDDRFRLFVTGDTNVAYTDGDDVNFNVPAIVYNNSGVTSYDPLFIPAPPAPVATIVGASANTDTGYTVDVSFVLTYNGSSTFSASRAAIPLTFKTLNGKQYLSCDSSSYSLSASSGNNPGGAQIINSISYTFVLKRNGTLVKSYTKTQTFTGFQPDWKTNVVVNCDQLTGDSTTEISITKDNTAYVFHIDKFTMSGIVNSSTGFLWNGFSGGLYPNYTMTSPISYELSNVSGSAGANSLFAYYLQTFVNMLGYESQPSGVSPESVYLDGNTIKIAGFTAEGNFKARRIYKSSTGTESSEYQFVVEDAVSSSTNGSSVFSDKTFVLDDANLGEVLTVTEPPPADLIGIVAIPNGFFAGFRRGNLKELWLSATNIPYSYPFGNMLTLHYDIIGLSVAGGDLYALTDGYPAVISGTSPDSMSRVYLASPQRCANRNSIVSMNGAVYYVSPSGICRAAPGALTVDVISEGHFTRDQWEALGPYTSRMDTYDNALLLSMTSLTGERNNLAFWFENQSMEVATHDEDSDLFHYDIVSDTLYFIADGAIKSFCRGAARKTALWKSKTFQGPITAWSSLRINCESETVVFKFFASSGMSNEFSNELRYSLTARRNESRRLPMTRPERAFAYQVESDGDVELVAISTSMKEIAP